MRCLSLVSVLGLLCGCSIVDPKYYEALENRTDGGDASEDAGEDAGEDAAEDGGEDAAEDAGDPTAGAAERCGQTSETMFVGGETIDIDTSTMADDQRVMAAPSMGNDGFFELEATSGEYWHFHLGARSPGRNPVLYIAEKSSSGCSPPIAVANQCRISEGDEHFVFRPSESGHYFVAVDDSSTGGGRYTLAVYKPDCGNGIREHGEPCEDSNEMDGDGCSSTCHVELTDAEGTGQTSESAQEHNNNADEADLVIFPTSGTYENTLDVRGAIGGYGDCYPDVFAVDVPAGHRLRVTALVSSGASCTDAEVPYSFRLENAAGAEIATPSADGDCPLTIDETLAGGGRYFIWIESGVEATDPTVRPDVYRLRFELDPE